MRHPRHFFLIRLLIAVVAGGGLSWSLTAPVGALAGTEFAASALVLAASVALDVRILIAFERHRVY